MKFTKPLIKGKLIKRYKRFFTDINLNGKTVTAHCHNTGSMKGLLEKDNEVYFKYIPKKKVKSQNKENIRENPFGVLKDLNLN